MDEPYLAAYGDTKSKAFIAKSLQIEQSLLPTLQKQAPNANIIGAKVIALKQGSIIPEILVTSDRFSLDVELIQKAVVRTCTAGQLSTMKIANCSELKAGGKNYICVA